MVFEWTPEQPSSWERLKKMGHTGLMMTSLALNVLTLGDRLVVPDEETQRIERAAQAADDFSKSCIQSAEAGASTRQDRPSTQTAQDDLISRVTEAFPGTNADLLPEVEDLIAQDDDALRERFGLDSDDEIVDVVTRSQVEEMEAMETRADELRGR
ncbi:MAG: hypothetical protein R2707_02620 [Acidimicrobiales bacterium]